MAIIQQMGIDAKILFDYLSKVEIGQTVKYQDLSALIGRDIQANRSTLETARRALLRDSIVFCTIRNEGIQRVGDVKKVEVATNHLGRIRNITRKSNKILAAVDDFNGLPNEVKIKHNAAMSVCGAIMQCTKSSSLARVEKALQNNNHILPVAETLSLFGA